MTDVLAPPPYGADQAFSDSLDEDDASEHTLNISKTHHGFKITDSSAHQLYYVARHEFLDRPNLILHGGYDTSGPELGSARFIRFMQDFNIHIGELQASGATQHEPVRCMADERICCGPAYRFDIPANALNGGTRRLIWRHAEDSKLGSLTGDYTLLDASTGQSLAMYREKPLNVLGKLKGSVEMQVMLSEDVQIAALLVIIAISAGLNRKIRTTVAAE